MEPAELFFLIKDNKLSIFYILKKPSTFLKELKVSPDKKSFALHTQSNKSGFIKIHNISDNIISLHVVESTRGKYHLDNGLNYIKREDFENYSTVESFSWLSNDELSFEISLAVSETTNFDGSGETKKLSVIYNSTTEQVSFL